MVPKLPRSLQITLGLVAVAAFLLSAWLEQTNLELLERHPIMVNLLSGVVGFAVASLVVAIGFNALQRRASISERRNRITTLWSKLVEHCDYLFKIDLSEPKGVTQKVANWIHKPEQGTSGSIGGYVPQMLEFLQMLGVQDHPQIGSKVRRLVAFMDAQLPGDRYELQLLRQDFKDVLVSVSKMPEAAPFGLDYDTQSKANQQTDRYTIL